MGIVTTLSKPRNALALVAALFGLPIAAAMSIVWQDHRADARKEEERLSRLTPEGAELESRREEEDACEWHVIRRFRSSRPRVEAWTARVGLPCAEPEVYLVVGGAVVHTQAGAPCTVWKSDELKVSAHLNESVVVIDSIEDYLCGGPFR